MKSLRKSFSRDHNHGHGHSPQASISTPRPSLSKPTSAIVPPKKIIRALASHRSNGPTELSFEKGDFFYVIREINEGGTWFEVHNPASGVRGLVPRSLFEDVMKSSNPTNSRTFSTISVTSPTSDGTSKSKPRVYYAVVLHDFTAERTDELDAKAGDGVSIVAQSNREWFVAKPIGKLGRPGLIPASFVEVRDPISGKITDVDTLIENGGLPSVEEWKKDMMTYKANSIALGVIDMPKQQSQQRMSGSPMSPISPPSLPSPISDIPIMQPPVSAPAPAMVPAPTPISTIPEQVPHDTYEEAQLLPEGILLEAQVVSFHYEEEYWFRVHATFQPYGSPDLPPARQLILFRSYNDFYDFQVELLNAYPHEGGQVKGHARVLPYMPGPAAEVNDEITASRQVELDDYLQKLCDLRFSQARYILEDQLIRAFLTPKPGDVEHEAEPRVEEIEALVYGPEDGAEEPPVEQMSRLAVNTGPAMRPSSDGSYYDEEAIRRPHNNNNGHAHTSSRAYSTHQRGESSSSLRGPSPLPPHMRPESHVSSHSRSGSRTGTPTQPYGDAHGHQRSSSYSRFSQPPSPQVENGSAPSSAGGSRGRSGSTSAAQSLNSPPISSTNPAPAFVKIKVFDTRSGEVIALRVHPRVTLAGLREKVEARLGSREKAPMVLRYSAGGNEDDVYIDDDEMLQEWMESTDKHVLWAE